MYSSIKLLHFVGIGGIGMSGIAEILVNLGYTVSGSDLSENANVQRLRSQGVVVHKGHKAEHVNGADAVVCSSAIKRDNPEVEMARRLRIPVVPRAEMLAELMRLKYGIAIAGTHGKTTTTSLTATILGDAGLDPTVINGGIVNAFASNARIGEGEFMVTEADESDGSFLKLPATIGVVTNMDPEHMDHYGDFDAVRAAFKTFVGRLPFYGLAVLFQDHPEVAALVPDLEDKRVVLYGFGQDVDYQALDIRQEGPLTHFTLRYRNRYRGTVDHEMALSLSLPGKHNVANALAAIAVARELGISWEVIGTALQGFTGVQRRFTLMTDSPKRTLIDDYAHHPEEIRATLEAARAAYQGRRIVAIFQPHRFSRVRNSLDAFLRCFSSSDRVFVDAIYPAGETPPPGPLDQGGQAFLTEGVARESGIPAFPLPRSDDWMEQLNDQLEPGDVALFLGAGDISAKGHAFAKKYGHAD
ncbi:MAG: UDP-N-acetylmuramate--L-alanine ligase [Magnetococcales bacterium]|nr:UDP-N-acetylmuramate--L-alanine ligase [Magnetococcales bacterium]